MMCEREGQQPLPNCNRLSVEVWRRGRTASFGGAGSASLAGNYALMLGYSGVCGLASIARALNLNSRMTNPCVAIRIQLRTLLLPSTNLRRHIDACRYPLQGQVLPTE
ncbi:hypothetical protein IG631_23879 [Alternaria alternata]|nr:hypothetical protein IG631_23879 [Alternaria alternata]